ncbi:MAG: 23S rRNA (uracil(1939)-C(5))-methyltransferase RlmD [Deltaproteobacteria bacterium]|nr:MAG: 23S rRNA (uracil(1939)-C(5))-methyltransferase RlmD [Deltaproteobacteria bacterium]
MTVQKGQSAELAITGVTFGGKGLARLNGLAVFVDQAIPGDRVRVRIIKKKKNYAEARLIELVTPSPDRIEPPCRYSGNCGGCKWQFLTYDRQLEYKRQHVIDSLEHIGLLKDVSVHPTAPSQRIFEYRNKMEFTCSDRKWLMPQELEKQNQDTGFAIGLHVPGTFYKVLDTQACLLQPELGNRILSDVRTYIKNSDAPVYGLKSHIGFWRFLMLRYSVAYNQWMVNIITATENREQVQPLADLLMSKYPEIISVVNNITSRKAGITLGEYEICLTGSSVIRDRIGPFEFEISANSFFQTNSRGAEYLYNTVKGFAALSGNEAVVDLYSGTGTIPIFLSDTVSEVIGIEISDSAVADAETNCRRNEIANCRFIQGDIKLCLSQLTIVPDLMVIDPPRAGMHKAVVKQVLEMSPSRIIYVSCNPATMARDLSLLQDRYRVLEIQPVDMFPHTYHIESVAKLKIS